MKPVLVTEIKDRLMVEFRDLKPRKPGKEWRRLLKSFNDWHSTDQAGNIWRNAARGLAGSEGLRQLVSDMQTILETEKDYQELKLSPAQVRQGRESSIALSASNLRRRKKRIGVIAK